MTGDFDPTQVEQYYGKVFVTESGSRYGITDKGIFTGRTSLEGAPVALIAGIKPEFYREALQYLRWKRPELQDRFEDYIHEVGEEPRKGLHLILSFRPAPVKGDSVGYGLVSSLIDYIEDME